MPARAERVPSRLALAARDIKLAHSVFALPFAVLGGALAADLSASPGRLALQLVLIVLCMVSARTWAMMVNRLADAGIDARNPRTRRRVLASGQLSARDGRRIAVVSGVLFCVCAALFWPLTGNAWPAMLCVPVLGFIALYSFTKRFTALCHVFLGAALALSPVAAAIAIEPGFLRGATIWLIAGFVLLWVAGFDMIYALQDLEFDRSEGLHSVPAALGWRGAIWVSRACHLGAFALIALAWHAEPRLEYVFLFAGLSPLAGLLVAEHTVLAQRGRAGLEMAFFTLNGIASVTLGVSGIVDLVV